MKKPSAVQSAAVLTAGILSLATTAQAQLITNSANLPPPGVYLSTDIHQIYGGPALAFLLTLPMHAPIANEAQRHPGGAGFPGDPNDEVEDFGSTLTGVIQQVVMGVPQAPQSFATGGPVQVLTTDRLTSLTGTFDTEMLSMNLMGGTLPPGVMIRESPTRQSLGQTTIMDIGGGMYQIDSFFDIFTELSIDGGVSWMPSMTEDFSAPRAGHMVLVPEPGSISLLAAGVAGLVGFVRRRTQA